MSCSCGTCTGCLSTDTISIPTGADGQNGANGVFGGFSGSWLFNSSTSTGPDSTYLRFNQADLTTATELYANNTNADSILYTAFLASFANAGNFGTVRIWKRLDSTKFWIGTITSVTAAGSGYAFGVTYLSNNGTFTDEDELVMSFTASGADGAAGSGTSGASIIYADQNILVDAGTSGPVAFVSVPITADLLSEDGDSLEVEIYYTTDDTDNSADNYYLSFGNDGYPTSSNEEYADWREFGTRGALIRSRITRLAGGGKAQTETSVFFSYTANGSALSLTPDASKCRMNSFNVNFDSTETNLLQFGFTGGTTLLDTTITSIVVKYVPYQAL